MKISQLALALTIFLSTVNIKTANNSYNKLYSQLERLMLERLMHCKTVTNNLNTAVVISRVKISNLNDDNPANMDVLLNSAIGFTSIIQPGGSHTIEMKNNNFWFTEVNQDDRGVFHVVRNGVCAEITIDSRQIVSNIISLNDISAED